MKDNKLTFEQWFAQAKAYAESINYCTSDNPEDYRGYFDSDYTPGEAIREDLSYCD